MTRNRLSCHGARQGRVGHAGRSAGSRSFSPRCLSLGTCQLPGILERKALGLQRFLWGSLRHAGLVEPLLAHMATADAAESVAAALAFQLMTGIEVPADGWSSCLLTGSTNRRCRSRRIEMSPHPDTATARQRWNEIRGQFGNALVLYRGVDIGAPVWLRRP